MVHLPLPCASRPKVTKARIITWYIAASMCWVIAGGVDLTAVHSHSFGPSGDYVERQHLADALLSQGGVVDGAVSAGSGTNAPTNRRGMQELEVSEPSRNDTSVRASEQQHAALNQICRSGSALFGSIHSRC